MKNLEDLAKNLFNEVLNKKTGGTFLVSTGQKVTFEDGYLVGVKGVQIPMDYFVNVKWPIKALYGVLNRLLISPLLNVGYWVDNGTVYIDIVSNVSSLEEAKKLGSACSQLAIWDCANNKEIRL